LAIKNQKDEQQAMQYALHKAWETLAPGTSLQAYSEANHRFRQYLFGFKVGGNFGSRVISPAEAAKIPDNSILYENMSYQYVGLYQTRNLLDKGLPLAFVTWHHGARRHADYALSRVLPQTAIFTRKTFQYGKVFSYPMHKSRALSLVRMQRFLTEKRPILYYLDGTPLGNCTELKILGVLSRISATPIKIIRAVKGIHLVPVTSYYKPGNKVITIFHSPLADAVLQPSKTDGDVLAELLKYLEDDLRKRAPVQALWGQIVHRVKREDVQ
jgi:hypothetical protein